MGILNVSGTVFFLFRYRQVHCLQIYHKPPALGLRIELFKPLSTVNENRTVPEALRLRIGQIGGRLAQIPAGLHRNCS